MAPNAGRDSGKEMKFTGKSGDIYKVRRAKNNEAVKKSRAKTKKNTQDIIEKVEKLRSENKELMVKIETTHKELALFRQLFIDSAGSRLRQLTPREMELLNADSDEEDDFSTESSYGSSSE